MDYMHCFNTKAGQEVLKDIAWFCRATKSTFHEDPRAHALMTGRHEVWLRIMKNLNMNSADFLKDHGLIENVFGEK